MRQQIFGYFQRPMQTDILAVVRISWFEGDRTVEIDEFRIEERGRNSYEAFTCAVNEALLNGADVSVMSDLSPYELGLADG
jgi:hypothetical protein